MKRSPTSSRPANRFVLVAGLIGSAIGGWWLGLVLLMLSSPAGYLLDAGAGLVVLALLCGIARLVRDHGGGDLRLVALAVLAGGIAALL